MRLILIDKFILVPIGIKKGSELEPLSTNCYWLLGFDERLEAWKNGIKPKVIGLLYLRSNGFSLLYRIFVLLFKVKHVILLLVYVALHQLYSILHKLVLGKTLITNSTVYLYSSLIVSLVGVFGGGITEPLPFFIWLIRQMQNYSHNWKLVI